MALPTLRNRSHDLVRNNPWCKKALETWVGDAIGAGIRLGISKGHAAGKGWLAWAETTACDADGLSDLYGLQALAGRCMWESGAVIIRRRWRRTSDGLPVPFQVQVLEPDYLDHDKTEETKTGYILGGVEFDKLGRRVAYWLFDQHPGEASRYGRVLQSRRVLADDVIYAFKRLRPGQIHGVPELAPVILRARDLDDYEDAELTRKKVEACFSVFVTSEGGAGSGVGDVGQDAKGRPAELRRQYETPLERLQREHGAAVRDITGNAQLSEEERQRLLGRENQRNQLSIDQVQNSVRGDLGMLSDTDKIVQAHQEMQRRISEAWAEGSQERVQAEVAAQRKLQQDMTALENQKASLILSMSGQVFDGLASMAEQAGGRQSAAYKLMFAMSKATAIAQAIINTEEAATKAMTLGPILGIPAASMVRGLGYASVGVMAAQAIQGMAHDGIDNIPREGTWLLDRGERVVDSRTNEDLKRYLARQNQGAQSGGAKLNVVINNNAGAQVDVQQGVGKDGAAQLIITMERVADSVYSRRQAADLRPGGVLSG